MTDLSAGAFAARHAAWAALHARFGPARSFPYAWRLPELARREGALAEARAALALGRTLYAMGRFAEITDPKPLVAALAQADPGLLAALDDLRRRCAWLRGEELPDQITPIAPEQRSDRAYFLYLRDEPAPLGALAEDLVTGPASVAEQCWAAILAHWARTRLGQHAAPAAAHSALAMLRRQAPAEAAHAAGVMAEAAFHLGPAWSLVWLDDALEQAERFGQHHLKARLLHFKARALEAAGCLGESGRFLKLARETAERQGAWRYLRGMAP
jgi:hypothetical protein